MSLQVEKLENNTAKLTIEVPAEELDKAIQKAYQKNKNKFNVPGFRKGKVPYAMIEKMYGAGVFYEEAANDLIPEAYANAAAESELEIVARPEISVTQIEKGKPFVFEAEVTLKPEVKLGEYKGIKVEKADTKVTAKEVNAELDKIKEQNARLVAADDKAIEEGDQATIDFEGFVDGVAFEGGKGEDYPLTIGSHSFIDTFEDQLVGKKVGEEVEVNVTFPEEYQAKELAGKPAMFKVTIKEIKVKEYPKVDDEFAQEVSEFDTLAEYKADIKKGLVAKKKEAAAAEKESKVIEEIVKNSEMDIPEKMIEAQAQQMVEEFAQNIAMQGISFDQYMQFTGSTVEQLLEQVKPQAKARIESSLVLEEVVKAEKIEATDEEFEKLFKVCKEKEITLLVDEAYHYFYPKTFIKYALNNRRVFVTRTFSKLFSMAGCRLGYVCGHPEDIKYVQKFCTPHNTNAFAMLFAEKILTTPGMVDGLIVKFNEGRSYLLNTLDRNGYRHKGEAGNFLFIEPKTCAKTIVERMKNEKNILIKEYQNVGEFGNCLRVSIGEKQYMKIFMNALLEIDK